MRRKNMFPDDTTGQCSIEMDSCILSKMLLRNVQTTSLEQTKELALLQLFLILFKLLHQLIPLCLRPFSRILRRLRLLGHLSTLHFPLRRTLEDQTDRRTGTHPNRGEDTCQSHPTRGPHLIPEGGRTHGDDISFLDEAGAGGIAFGCDGLDEDVAVVVFVEDEAERAFHFYEVVARGGRPGLFRPAHKVVVFSHAQRCRCSRV
mmetsp:Transcript_26195/g.54716  ORF Transcript_26195/g.54716 Transcript_26195/m.54716 type:complete len:204 (+) Transcript_26195:267-878(+)